MENTDGYITGKVGDTEIVVTMYPTADDWIQAKRRALITVDKPVKKMPDHAWMNKLITSKHSPLRRLKFSVTFYNIPSFVSVHFCRHVHLMPYGGDFQAYVTSQRNDRQKKYDRDEAPQNAPVNMILDMNAEELMVIAHKRLCFNADPLTVKITEEMLRIIEVLCPEFHGFFVPECEYLGRCDEAFGSCGYFEGKHGNS